MILRPDSEQVLDKVFFVRTGKAIPQEDGSLADGVFDTLYDVVNFISS